MPAPVEIVLADGEEVIVVTETLTPFENAELEEGVQIVWRLKKVVVVSVGVV